MLLLSPSWSWKKTSTRRRGAAAALVLLSLLAPAGNASRAEPVPGEESLRVSGLILAVDAGGASATIDLTAMQISPGLHAQVVRQLGCGWVEVARGRITSVTPGGSYLAIEHLAAGLPPTMIGDHVTVYLTPPPWAASARQGPGSSVQAEPLAHAASLARPGWSDDGLAKAAGERLSISIGLAGGFVAALRDAPANAPVSEAGMWGPGGGGGLLLAARFWRFLGLKLGLFYDSLTLTKETTVQELYADEEQRVATSYRPQISSTLLRLPLLLEGVLPVGPLRLSLGLGPELAFGLQTTADLEVTTPGRLLTGQAAEELQAARATLHRQLSGEPVN
ncbi:MAG: hypothetical protein FJ125_14895, partial [Deltaproteobacteria bacterium]|nr:hypothetical protein [Deltaproteobacteria bacterium]